MLTTKFLSLDITTLFLDALISLFGTSSRIPHLRSFLSDSLEKVEGDPPHEVALAQGPLGITYVAPLICHHQGVVKALASTSIWVGMHCNTAIISNLN